MAEWLSNLRCCLCGELIRLVDLVYTVSRQPAHQQHWEKRDG